jgi:hypothetical protein
VTLWPWIGEGSEAESAAKAGTFSVFVDVLSGDWFLDDFADAE